MALTRSSPPPAESLEDKLLRLEKAERMAKEDVARKRRAHSKLKGTAAGRTYLTAQDYEEGPEPEPEIDDGEGPPTTREELAADELERARSVLTARSTDVLAIRGELLRHHEAKTLVPHRQQLAKFLQNAVRTMAGLSVGLVTAAVAIAGVDSLEGGQEERFRNAYLCGIGGLVGGFLYFAPLLAMHIFDMRFNLRWASYKGRLAGRATNYWALGLAAGVAFLQVLVWGFGIYELVQLAWNLGVRAQT